MSEGERAEFASAVAILTSSESKRTMGNQSFVAHRVEAEATKLVNPDGRPIARRQAQAMVADEDTTLMVAGAGKTSVIADKVNYHLRRGLANPAELLVKAYGKLAVEELKVRIEIPEIHTWTFHSFGVSILRKRSASPTCLSPLAEDNESLNHFVKDALKALVQLNILIQEIIDIFTADLEEPPLDPAKSDLSAAEWVTQEPLKMTTTSHKVLGWKSRLVT